MSTDEAGSFKHATSLSEKTLTLESQKLSTILARKGRPFSRGIPWAGSNVLQLKARSRAGFFWQFERPVGRRVRRFALRGNRGRSGVPPATSMLTDEKVAALNALAKRRKRDRLSGHFNIADFHHGAYDNVDQVSPWTKSAGNIDSALMIVLLEWSSSSALSGPFNEDAAKLGYDPALYANQCLIRLVKDSFGLGIENTYVTTLFVFVKDGSIGAPVPHRDLMYCARKYLIPQIEIVRPRTVICAGANTLNAVRLIQGLEPVRIQDAGNEAIEVCGAKVYGVPHVGKRGIFKAGGESRARQIWREVATASQTLTIGADAG